MDCHPTIVDEEPLHEGAQNHQEKGRFHEQEQNTLMGWKPMLYSLATLATVVLAAGAKWRPR